MRAFQRAHGINDSGLVGPRTRAALSARLASTGAAHAPEASGPRRADGEAVLAEARQHVGYREIGENGNKFSRHFDKGPQKWCATTGGSSDTGICSPERFTRA